MSETISETILQEAARIVDGDREKTYDAPERNFERIRAGWKIIFGVDVNLEQVALAMVWLKIAREVHEHKRDNLVDAAGYLRCIERMMDAGVDVRN